MKNVFIALGTIWCSLAFSADAMDQAQFNGFKQKLQDPNPTVRIDAIDAFVQSLGKQFEEDQPGNIGNDVVPVLAAALGDTEAKVRADAAGGLAMIAYVSQPKLNPVKPGVPDLKSYPPLQATLEHAMDDPSENIRNSALVTYLLTFPVPASLQDKLVNRFDGEQKNILFRHTIMGALLIDGSPTIRATALLERLVNAPETTWQVAQMVPVSLNPPDVLLSGFVKQIPLAKDSPIRYALFQAIAKYGKRAKPYLDELEKAKEAEADSSTKHNMQAAIDSIRDAH